jgi:hypothetical protein
MLKLRKGNADILYNMLTDCSVTVFVSVPDPDPSDPHVFGPPGSGFGSISHRYGSGSFYQQAKIKNNKKIFFN